MNHPHSTENPGLILKFNLDKIEPISGQLEGDRGADNQENHRREVKLKARENSR